MNSKTAKMLTRFALLIGQPPRKCREIWYNMPWKDRAKNREQIWGLIAKHPEQIAQKKEDLKAVKDKKIDRFMKIMQPFRAKEAKAQWKALKLHQKQRRKLMNKQQGFISKTAAWMGGLIRGKK